MSTQRTHGLSRRRFLQVSALGIGTAFLAACELPATVPSAAEPSREDLPIIYWSMFGLEEAAQAQNQVERFNERTGENAIFMSIGWGNVAQKAQVAIEGGNPPDMVSLWSQAYSWGPRGLLQPLEDYAAADGFDGEGWSVPAWEALWSEGHLWGTGHTLNVWGLHLNREQLEAEGVDADNLPTEIAGLDELGERMTTWDDDGNLTRLGFLPWQNSNLWHWGWAHGASFYDEDTDTITADQDEGLLQALEWFRSYADKYDIEKIDRFRSGFGRATMSSDDPWYVGKVSMQIDGSWKRSWIPRYAPDLNYTVAKSPAATGIGHTSLVEIGAMFNVPTGAKNPEGGWKLALEMASAQNQIEFGNLVGDIPPLNSAARDPDFLNSLPFNELFVELTETSGRAWPRIPVLSIYQQEMNRIVDQVVHGRIEPAQALADMTAKVQDELNDFREQTA